MSHSRILLVMAILSAAGSLLTGVFVSPRFGIAVLIGGVLSFVNYYWLKSTLRGIFEKAVDGEKPKIYAFGYILRYIVFGLIIAFIYLSHIVPVAGIIAGLGSFAIAVVIEGFLRIFYSNNK